MKEEAELDLRTCAYLEYLCSTKISNGREGGEYAESYVCRILFVSSSLRSHGLRALTLHDRKCCRLAT